MLLNLINNVVIYSPTLNADIVDNERPFGSID